MNLHRPRRRRREVARSSTYLDETGASGPNLHSPWFAWADGAGAPWFFTTGALPSTLVQREEKIRIALAEEVLVADVEGWA
jgi:hypothetical protein